MLGGVCGGVECAGFVLRVGSGSQPVAAAWVSGPAGKYIDIPNKTLYHTP